MVVVLVVVDVLATTVHLSSYALSPGPTIAVSGMISVPAKLRRPLHGGVYMTAIYEKPAHPIDVAHSWVDSNLQIVPAQSVSGGLSDSELQQLNAEQMTNSKQDAEVVALRLLGYTVPEHGTGAQIVQVQAGSPAAGHLSAAETITAVDGKPISLVADVHGALVGVTPGQAVTLSVERPSGGSRQVTLVTGRNPQDPSVAFLGVALTTRDDHFDMPIAVNIDAQGIGGPSAGLAFTLGLLDEMTNGDLTGGHKVAATGEIETDGTVAAVGGVDLKAVSVAASGATLFLVPRADYQQAASRAGPHLRVVAVNSVADALAALAKIGGDVPHLPLPTPPAQ
ncbi:MAG TPA: PDZ domain-containing protein [Acidimicrobiales bacterium]|nr:PDZ domain-containing protein [Acidimicrobiales bacterium]